MHATLPTALRLVVTILVGVLASGCAGDDDDDTVQEQGGGLPAPSDLSAAIVAGGVHLTWQDNSTDEEEFMVLRQDAGSDWAPVGTAEANSTAFHDMTVMEGMRYTYFVHAMRADEASEPSNEVTIDVP